MSNEVGQGYFRDEAFQGYFRDLKDMLPTNGWLQQQVKDVLARSCLSADCLLAIAEAEWHWSNISIVGEEVVRKLTVQLFYQGDAAICAQAFYSELIQFCLFIRSVTGVEQVAIVGSDGCWRMVWVQEVRQWKFEAMYHEYEDSISE